jgi:hypothetical protein
VAAHRVYRRLAPSFVPAAAWFCDIETKDPNRRV